MFYSVNYEFSRKKVLALQQMLQKVYQDLGSTPISMCVTVSFNRSASYEKLPHSPKKTPPEKTYVHIMYDRALFVTDGTSVGRKQRMGEAPFYVF